MPERLSHPQAAQVDASPGMLSVRPIALDTFRENVILLARDCAVLRPGRLAGARKVAVRYGDRTLLATPIVCDEASMVGPTQAGLPQPMMRRLGAPAGALIDVSPAAPAATLDAVRAKIAGEILSEDEYAAIARDLAAHLWSDMEIAAFLVACASFMTTDETLSLTRGMIAAGRTLSWGQGLVVDKHCIGGVPGNRTSLIVAPIVAAHGLTIPKTSSRAITSPAGTADTMEVLARVDLSEDEMRAVVERCNGCIVWGGRVNLSPADDVLISVERPLMIDTREQMVASILSKKVAAGSTHLVLDVPVGPTAKIRDRASALKLKKLFEHVAGRLGLGLDVILTQALQPIGRGVGPFLEAQDALAVLRGHADAPIDLREKAIRLAGRVLEADPDLVGGGGEARARELLDSGAAARRMDAIMEAQGESPLGAKLGALAHEVCAPRDGVVSAIDCLRIAQIARLAGAPTDAGAGLCFARKAGETVRQGEPLYRIYATEPADFAFAVEAAAASDGVEVTG
jgi:thymidine phosphorylase